MIIQGSLLKRCCQTTHEPMESIEHHGRPSSNQRCAPTNRRRSVEVLSISIRWHLVAIRTAAKTLVRIEMQPCWYLKWPPTRMGYPMGTSLQATGNSRLAGMLCVEFDQTATQSQKRPNSNQRFDCSPEHGGAENCSTGAEKAPRWHQQADEQAHKRMNAQTQGQSHKKSIRTPAQVTNVKPADQANEQTIRELCLMGRQETKVTCCIVRWIKCLIIIRCFWFAQ